MDGVTATVAIRKLEREMQMEISHALPIVAMTAHTAAEYEAMCMKAGMNVCFTCFQNCKRNLVPIPTCLHVQTNHDGGVFMFVLQDFICKPIHRKELIQKMNRHALAINFN